MKKARNLAVASTLLLSGLSANHVFAMDYQTSEVEVSAYVTQDTLTVRKSPGMLEEKIGILADGTKFDVIQVEGNWSLVESVDLKGWVANKELQASDLLKKYSPKQQVAAVTINGVMYGVTTSSNTIIKNGFMPHNKVLDTLNANLPLTVLEVKNGYYRVIAPHIRGWMPVSDVKLRTSAVPYTEHQAVADKNGVIVRNGYMPHNHQVGTLNLNVHVRIIDLKNGFYRVVGENTRGWVHKSDLQLMPTGVYYGVTTNSNTAVKNGYSDSNKTISTLDQNEPLTVLETKNGYHRVIAPYTRGWIKTTSVNIQNEAVPYDKQTGASIAGNVSVLNGYMPHNHKVGTLQDNQAVEIIDIKNGYYRVVANNTRGWVSYRSIEITNGSTPPPTEEPNESEDPVSKDGIITASTLNVRSGPSTDYGSVGSLNFNSDVKIIDEQNGWFKIQSGNITGWSAGSYIEVFPLKADTYQYINLRKPSNVTAEQINSYIANFEKANNKKSVFSGKGQTFINVARKYGVNELFFAAFAIHESAYGTSIIAKSKNNLFGLGAYDSAPYDSAYYFNSVEDNINYEAAYIRHKYLSPGYFQFNGAYLGDKTGGLNVKYASDTAWGSKIASHMQKILAYNPNDYENVTAFEAGTPTYSLPDHTDSFPNGVFAKANSDLTLYLSKNGGKSEIKIPMGELFAVTAKTNDYWIQLRYNGNTYWTTFNFSTYKDYISINNLIRIQVDETLNVRQSPSTSSALISTLNNYTHVEGIVDDNKNIVTSGSWYQVRTPDGKIGWVSNTYAKRVYP
ncbi:SH3 domain-containing protein [Metabacillus sp. FJAT-53654]|uniref:SH3 domain-containing protein n=1 Tax=Metabacillus rhizosphaerae TaxID=3117747 RepID=A0ABZ2MXD8_9BACI